jgi:hypothetical protein
MSTAFSVTEILARLEARIAHHEQQMGFHQQQEVHHREQSAAHGAELEKVRQHFESFKTAALPAADLAGIPVVASALAGEEKPDDLQEFIGKRIMASKLIVRAIDRLGDDETFGANRVAAETNHRYYDQLKRPVDARKVSVVLRRLRDAGELHQVKSGGAAHEALYSKRRQG